MSLKLQIGLVIALFATMLLTAATGFPPAIPFILSILVLMIQIERDKKVNWFEGLQRVALYLIIAVLFFFYK